MHACLNVDEIVRLIARELVASGRNGTASGLACCRKSFEDPVLDALWATQNGLIPLLMSFPRDVWNGGRFTKTFKRLPTTMEWARFRKYARRMRELTEYGIPSGILSVEVFSVMQFCTINEPLLPNLETLLLWGIDESFIQFIPMFLSPRITSIFLKFFPSDLPNAMFASMITAFPALCPNLQAITLRTPPIDPMTIAAVSGIPLVINRNALQQFDVDSPLTEEASEVIYKLPNLCSLSVVIERGSSLPSASLPNLTKLAITCGNEDGWPRLFHGATFGKLESVDFRLQSEQIGDFLEAFERAALSSSIQNTLSKFRISTSYSWNPNYSSLLPFTQLVDLDIQFSCDGGCSSRVDDDIVINLSRAMPKLEFLKLGDAPCHQFTTGVTANGLVALAHHCPNLSLLRIHFQVVSLSAPPGSPEMTPDAESTALCMDCALTKLEVGEIPVPEGSVLRIALTLLRIFPRLDSIFFMDEEWGEIEDAINYSKRIINHSRATLETGS